MRPRNSPQSKPNLRPNAVILSDNAHDSSALSEWAERTGRHYLFFKEQPSTTGGPGTASVPPGQNSGGHGIHPAPTLTRCRATSMLKRRRAAPLVLLAAVAGCTASPRPIPRQSLASGRPADPVGRICGHPILNSPFSYNGASGGTQAERPGCPRTGNLARISRKRPPGSSSRQATIVTRPIELNPDTVITCFRENTSALSRRIRTMPSWGAVQRGTLTVLSGGYSGYHQAIDSNFAAGNQSGVTIEYLTIEKFQPKAMPRQSTRVPTPTGPSGTTRSPSTCPGAGPLPAPATPSNTTA